MKRNWILIAALACLAAGLALTAGRRGRDPQEAQPGARNPQAANAPARRIPGPSASPEAERPRVSSRKDPVGSPEEREAAMDRIQEAVVTYSPEAVKSIAPLLLDPDPELRASARDGLINLGERDAIGPLRLAAKKLDDPTEAKACLDAADFLELPSWSDTPEAKEMAAEISRTLQAPSQAPPP